MKNEGCFLGKDIGMTELQMFADLRTVLKDYYNATFTSSEKWLEIKFENGQTFVVSVKEKG